MWKMVEDMYHHTLHGYGGAPSEVDRIRLYSVSNIQDILDIYYGPMNVSSLTTWFMYDLLPSLITVYFENKLPRHELFVSLLPKRINLVYEEYPDDDDMFEAIELEGEIGWEEIDEHVVRSLIEGYLRISLLVDKVDDVLYTGYSVKFTCRAFSEWFFDIFLVDAIDILTKKTM
jgi:hypothetical protein